MQTVVEYPCLGMWLSWLARFAHIEEVGGSSPFIPTILEKSELDSDREWVRISCFYQGH